MSVDNDFSEGPKQTVGKRISAFLIEVFAFREVRRSASEGRNQLRIALGLGGVAAAGFSASKLIDPAAPALSYWWWTNVIGAILFMRATIWLFLTIEGDCE